MALVNDLLREAGVVVVRERERFVPVVVARREFAPCLDVVRKRICLHRHVVDAVRRHVDLELRGLRRGVGVVPVVEVLILRPRYAPCKVARAYLDLQIVGDMVDLERQRIAPLAQKPVARRRERRVGAVGNAPVRDVLLDLPRRARELVHALERERAVPLGVRRDHDKHAPHIVLDERHRIFVGERALGDNRNALPFARALPEAEEPVRPRSRQNRRRIKPVRDIRHLFAVGDAEIRARVVDILVKRRL